MKRFKDSIFRITALSGGILHIFVMENICMKDYKSSTFALLIEVTLFIIGYLVERYSK